MKFDALLQMVGDFGLYQKRVLFFLYLDSILDAFHAGLTVFIFPHLDFRCSLKGMENDTFAIQGPHHERMINETIPQHMKNGKIVYNSCERFQDRNETSLHLEKCNSWVFDKSIYETTIIEELSLVCNRKILLSHSVTALFLGVFAGAALIGALSDWIGRKWVIIVCVLMQGVAGIGSAFCHTITSFLILRFLIGFGGTGSYISSFVLGIEIVGTEKRPVTCLVTMMFFASGFCLLTAAGYFVTSWRIIVLIISTPSVLLSFCYIWSIQESPRLLFTKNKHQQAFKIIKLIAKTNKRLLPENIEEENILVEKVESLGTCKVWTSKTLCLQNFVVAVNWLVVSLCYYALTLNSSDFSTNVHLNFFLGAFVEFPAYLISLYLLTHNVGRRILFASSMVAAGMACFISTFSYVYGAPEIQWITMVFCLIGRFASTTAFAIIYLYVCEIYPTVARNGALGVCMTFNRLGSLTAPYVMILGDYVPGKFGKGLPFIILAITTSVAGPLVMLLPESSNQSIPDTIQESKLMQRSRRQFKKIPTKEEVEMKSNLSVDS